MGLWKNRKPATANQVWFQTRSWRNKHLEKPQTKKTPFFAPCPQGVVQKICERKTRPPRVSSTP